MPRQRHRAILDGTLLAITALFVMGGLIALGFLRNISEENRALILIISSVGTFGCLIGLMFLSAFWKRLRKRIWLEAMSTWKLNSQSGVTPKSDMTTPLSEDELSQLAIHIYSWIGYRILNRDRKDYLQLINPEGSIELIACKQQPYPIELHHVYSLELEMKRTKAVRGFFWAPAGFTSETIDWVGHRSIVLTDRDQIRLLVDCAYAKGSRLLEY